METALLILVLVAGDPASHAAAQTVAAALRAERAEAAVVLPPESSQRLAALALADADLVARNEKPILATAANPRLVLVRIENRDGGGAERIVEVELWAGGRRSAMAAVAGSGGDPAAAAAEGARRLLREAALDAAGAAQRREQLLVASYAERGAWDELVAAVAAMPDATPRLRHQAILARLRLGDRTGAQRALEALARDAPADPATSAAAEAVAADAGATDVLRDPQVEAPGNVLR